MEPMFEHMASTWVERPESRRKLPAILKPLECSHVDKEELELIRVRLGEEQVPSAAADDDEAFGADKPDEEYIGDGFVEEEEDDDEHLAEVP